MAALQTSIGTGSTELSPALLSSSNNTVVVQEYNLVEIKGVMHDSKGFSLVGWHKDGEEKTNHRLMAAMSQLKIVDGFKADVPFCDIFPMLGNSDSYEACIGQLVEEYKGNNYQKVVGIEARGFPFAGALADQLKAGFAPIRKAGKTPGDVITQGSTSEYAKCTLEINKGYIQEGDNILLCDDLIATGGTAEASIKLIKRCGGEVNNACFLVSIPDLGGEAKLQELGVKVYKLFDMQEDTSIIRQWFCH